MLMGISVELQRSVEEATGAVPTKLTGLAVLVVAVVSSMETVGVGDLAVWSLLGWSRGKLPGMWGSSHVSACFSVS